MKHALFLVFISLFMPYAHAKEAWIDPSKYFDEEDKKIFSFLKTNTDDAGSFQCLEISSWAKEKDKEKKHIYREIKDYGQMYASSKECKKAHLDSLELMAPAVCIYKEGYSYDSVAAKCVAVKTDCGPGIRPRNKDNPSRFFYKIHKSKAICQKQSKK